MKTEDREFLEGGNYISFSTRKKSGDWVATPVWFAPANGSSYVFSAGNAGKIKRLRNFSESRIAPCTFSGTVTGAWSDTQAVVLEGEDDCKIALKALHDKYGWQMLMSDILSKITGKMGRRAYIRIDP